MQENVFIGAGANLGDRMAALTTAVALLAPDVEVLDISNVYQTPPWGFTDQPAFLNLALQAATALDPITLLHRLKGIETRLGREPSFRFGPRAIDLDILFYGSLVYDSDYLSVPHPLAAERAFVLVPMREIAPDFIHPILKKTISELADSVDTSGIVIYREEQNGQA